ncbi:MAG: 4-phosphopantoate--beta-alanine ligase [Candidatus Methanogasteraceae archaeon]|nr:4-phosphopantoate--beta-alanine ligase [Methanosarcinales archaeon ANME-2c ERB4]
MSVPKNHPRYQSLKIRERLVEGVASGIASQVGLIAHGRGEAFDYLIGERTTASAMEGARAAAAMLLAAKNPVLSVNGNVAALVPNETIELGRILDATIEINLFYRTDERVRAIADHLRAHGASDLLGEHPDPDAALPLAHPRSLVCRDGIHAADVVLVPLEDGDRCQTLVDMRKSVIAIDLNPLSRTAQSATITIVDNVVRAIPNMIELVQQIRDFSEDRLTEIILQYDNHDALQSAIAEIVERGWRSELS